MDHTSDLPCDTGEPQLYPEAGRQACQYSNYLPQRDGRLNGLPVRRQSTHPGSTVLIVDLSILSPTSQPLRHQLAPSHLCFILVSDAMIWMFSISALITCMIITCFVGIGIGMKQIVGLMIFIINWLLHYTKAEKLLAECNNSHFVATDGISKRERKYCFVFLCCFFCRWVAMRMPRIIIHATRLVTAKSHHQEPNLIIQHAQHWILLLLQCPWAMRDIC